MAQNSFLTPNCPDPELRANAQGIARVAVDDIAAQLIVTFELPITPSKQTYLLNARSYSLTGGQRLFPHILTASLYNPPDTPLDLNNPRVLLQLDGDADFAIHTPTDSGAAV